MEEGRDGLRVPGLEEIEPAGETERERERERERICKDIRV